MRRLLTARRGGFSLIEILVAVIILALGLLGLGAVFPVVIREQKIAQDRISGTVAENNVRATLMGLADVNAKPIVEASAEDAELTITYSGWAALQEEWNYHRVINNLLSNPNTANDDPDFANEFDFSRDGLWDTTWTGNEWAPTATSEYFGRGDIVLVDNDRTEIGQPDEFAPEVVRALQSEMARLGINSPITLRRRFREARVPLSARLNPAGSPTDPAPSLVWDFVVRRKLETADPRALQVAVFIRRVDPRIRTQPGAGGGPSITPLQAMLDPNIGSARRLPVGEDGFTGVPTLDGTDGAGGVFYSGVHQVGALFAAGLSAKRNLILVTQALSETDARMLTQAGQRVVDNLGNVYTVAASGFNGSGLLLEVDPPVPSSVLDTDNDPTLTSIRQLIFTPQIPVSVFVMEVAP